MTESFRVIYSPRSWTDLRAIHRRIAVESSDNAARFLATLIASIDRLDVSPSSFTRVGRSGSTGEPIHKVVEWPYLIYYRVEAAAYRVTILAVRHGNRRQPRRFE